jgi:DNA mismatch repair protein MLH1
MLSEYFSMDISEDGRLETLPNLLNGYIPNLSKLDDFFHSLGKNVSTFNGSTLLSRISN